jgi:hypothetical protein
MPQLLEIRECIAEAFDFKAFIDRWSRKASCALGTPKEMTEW